MKKVLSKVFLLLIIFLVPCCVFAKKYESEKTSMKTIIDRVDFGQASLLNLGATKYFNMYLTGRAGVAFTGSLFNDYSFDIDINVELNLYDSEYKVIEKFGNSYVIEANKSMLYKIDIYEDEKNYKIEDIKYFSVVIDVDTDVDIISKTKSELYYLENYEIKVNVNKNNVYNVEESFLVNFKNNVIPINKNISLRHRYTREDGSKVNKKIVLSNIELEDYYELSINKGVRVLDIGKVDKVNTKKNYNLKYDYNVGKDVLKANDEFVFYLVNNVEHKIDGLSFEITMPDEVDESRISFMDKNGIIFNNVEYSVEGNVIKGRIAEIINADSSYAISVILPDKYFVNCDSNISLIMVMSFVLPIIYTIISFCILFISLFISKKTQYKGHMIFDKKINSLEVSYLYNGYVKDKDIASLIFSLADKGYVKINKLKKEYRIIKVKDYDEKDKVEQEFMNELFKEKNSLNRNDLISSLKNVKQLINDKMKTNKRKNKVFNNSILTYKIMFWLMIINIFVVLSINLLIEYQPSVLLVNTIICGIGYLIVINAAFKDVKPLEKLLYILVGLILIASPIVLTSYEAFGQSYIYVISYVLGVICMLLIGGISKSLGNRTYYGKKMYNKINAYKNYLLCLDSDGIDAELNHDKNCLYSSLSYCFALGIIDKLFDKFKEKDIDEPEWYNTNKYNREEFYNDIQNIYSDIFVALKNTGSNE